MSPRTAVALILVLAVLSFGAGFWSVKVYWRYGLAQAVAFACAAVVILSWLFREADQIL